MLIDVDLGSLPARMVLREPDALTSLAVRVDRPTHTVIDRAELVALAGPRGRDAAWLAELDAVLAAAERHGWTTPDGRVRAHVEWSA